MWRGRSIWGMSCSLNLFLSDGFLLPNLPNAASSLGRHSRLCRRRARLCVVLHCRVMGGQQHRPGSQNRSGHPVRLGLILSILDKPPRLASEDVYDVGSLDLLGSLLVSLCWVVVLCYYRSGLQ